jgi:G3E family GTPase
MPTPLSLITGLSPTLRAPVLDAALDPDTVVVTVEQDDLAALGVLRWQVVDRSGRIDAGEIGVDDDCGSCALVESLLPLLEVLADRDHWRHVVLAPPPAMEARPLVAALTVALPDEFTVDTVTCVADAVLLVSQLTGDELLAERGLALGAGDRRNVAELTARQIEYADVCVLANTHRIAEAGRLDNLLRHLNPRTEVVTTDPAGVPSAPVSRTGRFDLAAAEEWAAETWPAGGDPGSRRPEPSESGVTTVLWRSTRPLHPERLSDALEQIVDGVVRSRGVVWLANRPTQRLRWESAGYSASLGTLDEWGETGHLAECCLLATGLALDPAKLQAVLDGCLLTDGELAAGNWHDLDDPFAGVL